MESPINESLEISDNNLNQLAESVVSKALDRAFNLESEYDDETGGKLERQLREMRKLEDTEENRGKEAKLEKLLGEAEEFERFHVVTLRANEALRQIMTDPDKLA